MPEIAVVNQENKSVGKQTLNDAVFGLDADAGFLARVYTALAAGQRAGTHSTKSRGEVSGGGKKPWKQKGTGRARQGSNRSVQWRHGGVAHGPSPRSYATRINKKERQRALCLALSDAVREARLVVLDEFKMDTVKTKAFVHVMDTLEVGKGLIVLGSQDDTLALSGRNVADTKIVLDQQVNLHDLMKFDKLVFTQEAIGHIEERLS